MIKNALFGNGGLARRISESLRLYRVRSNKDALFPAGHFYSPVCNVDELAARRDKLWPEQPAIAHIDFNDAFHQRALEEWLPAAMQDFDYPATGPADGQLKGYYTDNSQFSHLDSRMLFTFLRQWRPARMVEVGGGYSTLLSVDINRRWLELGMHFTCIEPYPRPFLRQKPEGLSELLVERVEDVPIERFASLEAGDVLFIDSSHVCKTGSDVNHLYFEVLPQLRPGVRVHVHDVFLPAEYPQDWVIDQNRSWNEQYLLRAMLTHSSRYQVLFGCMYAMLRYPEAIQRALGLPVGQTCGGGSFWFEITAA